MRATRRTAVPRTRLIRVLAVALLAMSAAGGALGVTPVAARATNLEQFANVELPGELGQTTDHVYVPESGHSIRGYMLDYWRANGAESVYGHPISEPFASANGLYSQAFEGAVFQFRPELVWTDLPSVSLMPISEPMLKDRVGEFRRDGKRGGGGGDRRASAWGDLNPAGSAAQEAIQNGEIYDTATAQTVTGDFFDWYTAHEGIYYLGSPISQPLRERGVVLQYFTGGVLARDEGEAIRVLPVVEENARELGIDTTPVDQAGLPVYDELLFWESANPNPIGDPYSAGRKWIEISIAEQTLRAYQGENLISTTLVSTGLTPNDTEKGVFHVRYKLEEQDMAGAVDSTGAVVAMGTNAAEAAQTGRAPGQSAYTVEDVPHVMYINMDAEAMHGAYWHNNFGNPMSHGCINLPLDFAAFLYGWAPLGTMVWVH